MSRSPLYAFTACVITLRITVGSVRSVMRSTVQRKRAETAARSAGGH
jgi:hypothetical protein